MMRFLILCLFASLLPAADIAGIWVGKVPTRNGEQDIAFQLTQKGDVIGGKLYGDYRSSFISSGKVTGDDVMFVVVSPEQNGNQINETRLRFTGSLKNGELELTREREVSTNAGNGGGVQNKGGNAKITFKLKRLI